MQIKKPLVILEVANNHMGDVNHAINIINKYFIVCKPYFNKIDFAIKFQFRNLETYVHSNFTKDNNAQVKRFVETKLSSKEWKKIISLAKKKFKKIICTPFDEDSVVRLIDLKFDYLKIASCSCDEWPLLEFIAKKAKKKKIICSLGGADLNQIKKTISFFKHRRSNIRFLYCVAKYPTEPRELNLAYFAKLRDLFGNIIYGFSTHEDPNDQISGVIAYSMGARIFEKHIAFENKSYKANKYSTSPNQFKKWLSNLFQSIDRVGSIANRTKLLPKEKNNLQVFKRGVFLKKSYKNLKNPLNQSDIYFAFPAQKRQLLSNNFSKYNDIFLKKKIKVNSPIFLKDVKIYDNRKFAQKIREKILELINLSKVIIKNNSRLEISHHYGQEKFNKFGLCMLTIHNKLYCKKLLFLLHKQIHPEQYHKKKTETFFILFGKIELTIIKKNKIIFVKQLKTGESFTIKPYEIHKFVCKSKKGSVIEELSTYSSVSDSFYVDKKINKNLNRKTFISL